MGVEEKRASVTTTARCRCSSSTRRLVDSSTTRESDDTIPRSASAKGKSGLKIQLNLGGVKVQKMGGTEATDNDGGNKKEEPRRRPTAVR